MEILVCNRAEIERGITVQPDYVVISICDPGTQKASVQRQPGLRDVLFLAFHDARPSAAFELPPEIKPFTPAQADEIRDFVRKHEPTVGTIVVHCQEGMSRSPAVAAAISDALGLDARRFWQLYSPNQHVYHTVAAAFDRGGAARNAEGQ
ncbi:MAG: hypothetical protein M0Z50_04200 [Planctomycetia bacterium]|nr:hypothetical protein [Planctomycetia bacterium]